MSKSDIVEFIRLTDRVLRNDCEAFFNRRICVDDALKFFQPPRTLLELLVTRLPCQRTHSSPSRYFATCASATGYASACNRQKFSGCLYATPLRRLFPPACRVSVLSLSFVLIVVTASTIATCLSHIYMRPVSLSGVPARCGDVVDSNYTFKGTLVFPMFKRCVNTILPFSLLPVRFFRL